MSHVSRSNGGVKLGKWGHNNVNLLLLNILSTINFIVVEPYLENTEKKEDGSYGSFSTQCFDS